MIKSITIGRATDEEFDDFKDAARFVIVGVDSFGMILPKQLVEDKVAITMESVQIDVDRIQNDMLIIFTYGDNNDYMMEWVVL
jgi:hypothetical protein